MNGEQTCIDWWWLPGSCPFFRTAGRGPGNAHARGTALIGKHIFPSYSQIQWDSQGRAVFLSCQEKGSSVGLNFFIRFFGQTEGAEEAADIAW